MDPIFEIPTRGRVVNVCCGETVYAVHQLEDGANVLEAPLEVGRAHEWTRRVDLEQLRKRVLADVEAQRVEAEAAQRAKDALEAEAAQRAKDAADTHTAALEPSAVEAPASSEAPVEESRNRRKR